MEKGINLQIQELKESIANVINNAKLPPGIVQMILSETLIQVQMLNNQTIEAEKQMLKEGEQDGQSISK